MSRKNYKDSDLDFSQTSLATPEDERTKKPVLRLAEELGRLLGKFLANRLRSDSKRAPEGLIKPNGDATS